MICGIRRNTVPDMFTRIVGGTVAENSKQHFVIGYRGREIMNTHNFSIKINKIDGKMNF